MGKKRLGEVLLERGAITDRQLTSALAFQRERGGRIGQALVTKGYLTEEQLIGALGEELGLPVIDIPNQVDAAAIKLLKTQFCETHDAFPLHVDSPPGGRRTLTLALSDPLDLATLEEVEFITGCRVQPALATTSQIRLAILRHYYKQNVDQQRAGSRMTLVRRGGQEEEVDTSMAREETGGLQLVQPSPSTQPPRFGEEPEADDILALTDEIAETTEEVDPRRAALDRQFGRSDAERFEQLERKFWALMRIMENKGLITTEEFLAEFDL